MRILHFFATAADLLPVMGAVEAENALAYRLMGNFEGTVGPVYLSAADVPELGIARYDSSAACDSLLVSYCDARVNLRRIVTTTGVARTLVDQLENPDTIEFSPGGVWGADVLISGRVATVSEAAASKTLMRLFVSAITRRFTKVRAYMVGPEALARFDSGARLTTSARAPKELDLARI